VHVKYDEALQLTKNTATCCNKQSDHA